MKLSYQSRLKVFQISDKYLKKTVETMQLETEKSMLLFNYISSFFNISIFELVRVVRFNWNALYIMNLVRKKSDPHIEICYL